MESNNRPNSKIDSTAVAASRPYSYGRAIGLGSRDFRKRLPRGSFGAAVRFYFGEYISGPVFVLFLASYLLLSSVASLNYSRILKQSSTTMIKTAIDLLVGAVGLVLAIPILLIIPILIKLDSPGPVFYTQIRVGKNRRRRDRRSFIAGRRLDRRARDRRREDCHGRPFRVIKFRTMINNAENKTGAVWATKDDARITKLGRLLRKSRIDEIPQLINVLKGDMSAVGPRPERPVFVRDLSVRIPDYISRLQVKPGITGQAQVTNGYDTSLQSVLEKVKNDVDYIRNWTVWSDIKILMKTVLVVITGKGAC
jgi:lipopolysaccharide/colanic/teichoic acid biosynthesis glycosyltransferase